MPSCHATAQGKKSNRPRIRRERTTPPPFPSETTLTKKTSSSSRLKNAPNGSRLRIRACSMRACHLTRYSVARERPRGWVGVREGEREGGRVERQITGWGCPSARPPAPPGCPQSTYFYGSGKVDGRATVAAAAANSFDTTVRRRHPGNKRRKGEGRTEEGRAQTGRPPPLPPQIN